MVSMARRLTLRELTAPEGEGPTGRRFTWLGAVVAALIAALAVVLCLVRVWARTEVVRVGYDLRAAGEQQRSLVVERDRLRRELAALRAPDRIERLARDKLSMQEPTPAQRYSVR